jgi:hypothetical protein
MSAPASIQHAIAAALLNPAAPCPPGLRCWNGSDPARRLAVHRNNVMAGLVDVLADTFPTVQRLVGTDFFRDMASVFVRAHPPRSPLMAQYGAGFADFVGGFAPATAMPHLPDMARLEFARLQALHAADAAPVSDAVLAAALAAPHTLPGLRLVLHASVAVLSSAHTVVSLWAAHQGSEPATGEGVKAAMRQPEHALVLRDGLEVLVIPVDAATALFASRTLAGDAFGVAAAAASNLDPAFNLVAALALLLRHQVLLALLPAQAAD